MTEESDKRSSINKAMNSIPIETQGQIDLIRQQAISRANKAMLSEDDERFVAACRRCFDNGVKSINGETLARITQSRNRVLDKLKKPFFTLSPYVPVATIAAVFLTLAVMFNLPNGISPEVSNQELESMAISEDFEIYEELEFYQWLENEDLFT